MDLLTEEIVLRLESDLLGSFANVDVNEVAAFRRGLQDFMHDRLRLHAIRTPALAALIFPAAEEDVDQLSACLQALRELSELFVALHVVLLDHLG